MLRIFALLGLLFCCTTAQAELDSALQYSFVQLNYYQLNPDDDINGHGKGIDASILMGRRGSYFVSLRFRDPDNNYQDAKREAEERSLWGGEVGIGRYQPITDTLHWSVAAMFHRRDAEKDGSFEEEGWNAGEETGGGLHLGLRQLLSPSLEWGAEAAAVYVHRNETHGFAYLQWHLNSFISLGVKTARMQEEVLHSGFLRISF